LFLCFHFIPELGIFPQKKGHWPEKSKVKMNGCFIIGLAGFVIKVVQCYLDPLNPTTVQIISLKAETSP
jgi:hypothetical protein